MKHLDALTGAFVLAAAAALGQAQAAQPLPAPQPAPACARACLEGFVDRYLDAMLAHEVNPQLFAREVKFTENGVQLPLGSEGLWFRMSGKGTYKFYVPDVETQQVAFIGTARERTGGANANPSMPVGIVLRLKIVAGRITEAEQLVVRPDQNQTTSRSDTSGPSTPEKIEKMGAPHPIYAEVIPAAQRPSRETLIEIANHYFTGLQRNDGKGHYPFTDDCHRIENGNNATNVPMRNQETGQTETMGCRRQFEVALRNTVSRVRDRRFVAVDRERGIVFAFAFFDHENINWTWQLGELFKIQDGKIRRIEALFHRAPYGIGSGWSTYEQGLSDGIQSVR